MAAREQSLVSLTDALQVITLAIRTPLTKAKKGGLKDTKLDDLLIALLTVPSQAPSRTCIITDSGNRQSERNQKLIPAWLRMCVSETS